MAWIFSFPLFLWIFLISEHGMICFGSKIENRPTTKNDVSVGYVIRVTEKYSSSSESSESYSDAKDNAGGPNVSKNATSSNTIRTIKNRNDLSPRNVTFGTSKKNKLNKTRCVQSKTKRRNNCAKANRPENVCAKYKKKKRPVKMRKEIKRRRNNNGGKRRNKPSNRSATNKKPKQEIDSNVQNNNRSINNYDNDYVKQNEDKNINYEGVDEVDFQQI